MNNNIIVAMLKIEHILLFLCSIFELFSFFQFEFIFHTFYINFLQLAFWLLFLSYISFLFCYLVHHKSFSLTLHLFFIFSIPSTNFYFPVLSFLDFTIVINYLFFIIARKKNEPQRFIYFDRGKRFKNLHNKNKMHFKLCQCKI